MTTTHLFGEMDLDLSLPREKLVKEAGRIAEACGYAGDDVGDTVTVCSQDCEIAKIKYRLGKVVQVKRSVDEGHTWEELDFKENLFSVSPDVLKKYNSKINYGRAQKLPMSQGTMLNEIVKKYNIRATEWGIHQDLIGVRTLTQTLIWRDCGSHAEFLGGINADGSDFK